MAIIIQLRRGNAPDWTANNPVLAEGEIGTELDTGKFKVGDGSTPWNSLEYSSGTDGEDGSVWHHGTTQPAVELGQDGDYYLNTDNGFVHKKTDGVWSIVANIQGPQGEQGPPGEQGPEGPQGEPGTGLDASIEEKEGQTGTVVLDFLEKRTQVVSQGSGAITYEFPNLSNDGYLDWDESVWDFGTQMDYPKLAWEAE